jgi:hypothetical protein
MDGLRYPHRIPRISRYGGKKEEKGDMTNMIRSFNRANSVIPLNIVIYNLMEKIFRWEIIEMGLLMAEANQNDHPAEILSHEERNIKAVGENKVNESNPEK